MENGRLEILQHPAVERNTTLFFQYWALQGILIMPSTVVSTRVDLSRKTNHSEVRRGFIYDQEIRWGSNETSEEFNLQTILLYCDCKYFTEETKVSGYCYSHIIGQLRRLIVYAWEFLYVKSVSLYSSKTKHKNDVSYLRFSIFSEYCIHYSLNMRVVTFDIIFFM